MTYEDGALPTAIFIELLTISQPVQYAASLLVCFDHRKSVDFGNGLRPFPATLNPPDTGILLGMYNCHVIVNSDYI